VSDGSYLRWRHGSPVNVAALFSGGKDSTYALYVAQQRGLEVSRLVTVIPGDPDAMLYHTPNIGLTSQLSDCLGIPLITKEAGRGEERELEALRAVLDGLAVDGLIMGTIASDYQKSRVDAVCHDLGLRCFAPLWRHDQVSLMNEYLKAGFRIIITGVAAEGLDADWLGREIDEAVLGELLVLNRKHGLSPCGEGGEYESLVLDGPNFRKRLVIEQADREWKGSSGTLKVVRAKTDEKS